MTDLAKDFVQRLEGLSPEKFDFTHEIAEEAYAYAIEHDGSLDGFCGTVGCAIGWGAKWYPEHFQLSGNCEGVAQSREEIGKLLGITCQDVRKIFYFQSTYIDNNEVRNTWEITPQHVARRLRVALGENETA